MAAIKTNTLYKQEGENSDYRRGLLLGDKQTEIWTGTEALSSIYELEEVGHLIFNLKNSGKQSLPALL